MDDVSSLLQVISILFAATFVRSAIGFGDALLAMPFLILAVGLQTATPLVALASSTISLILLVNEWRALDFRGIWPLILATFVGIPVGLILLRLVPEDIAKACLGTLLILYGLYQLLRLSLPPMRHPALAIAFGFVAGAFGGAYNTNGAIIAVYGTLQKWEPAHFRINLQGYFLLTNWLIVASHWLAGLWTPHVLHLYLYSLPGVAIGAWLGGVISKRVPKEMFSQLIYALLVFIGVVFVV